MCRPWCGTRRTGSAPASPTSDVAQPSSSLPLPLPLPLAAFAAALADSRAALAALAASFAVRVEVAVGEVVTPAVGLAALVPAAGAAAAAVLPAAAAVPPAAEPRFTTAAALPVPGTPVGPLAGDPDGAPDAVVGPAVTGALEVPGPARSAPPGQWIVGANSNAGTSTRAGVRIRAASTARLRRGRLEDEPSRG